MRHEVRYADRHTKKLRKSPIYRRKKISLARRLNQSYLGKRGLVMTKTTMSSKGQISIPKAVRERLNLKAGTEISIDVQGEALVMKRLVRNHPDWRTMRGMFRDGADLLKDLTDNHAAEIARDNARLQGR
jgi:AbrB family looped-hinge helix DNA binding protein